MRVVSVIGDFRPVYTGEGEWWLRMAPRLRARGVDVEILTHARGQSAKGREVIDGTPVERLATDARRPYRSWISAVLHALIERRGRFQVAQFHGPTSDAVYASCLAGRLLGWRTVYRMTLVGEDDLSTVRREGRLGIGRLSALRLADGYVAMSPALTRGFEDAGFLARRLLIVPQGADTERFRPAGAEERRSVRHRLGIPQSARVALFCGAVVRRKGVDILIEAWRRVCDRIEGALLVLVGPNHRSGLDAPEHRSFSEGIERRLHELGLQRSARLVGYQEDVRPFFAAADVFVLPSRAEGQPAVIGEALASGLPCVVSQLDGISDDDFQHEQEGFVVPSFAPEDYAAPIAWLLTHGEAAEAMGARARERALARFDLERIADRYATFLLTIGRRPDPLPHHDSPLPGARVAMKRP